MKSTSTIVLHRLGIISICLHICAHFVILFLRARVVYLNKHRGAGEDLFLCKVVNGLVLLNGNCQRSIGKFTPEH